MAVDSSAELLALVRRLQLLPAHEGHLTDAFQASFPQARALAAELVRRGWLTPYQINQIFLGRGDGLALGPYVLLERLGAGGMGEVFKARHSKLGRVVALKLIRKDRLDNPAAVRRFHREVQAAAQLEHPHIVRAYDAGEAGGAHFFVMEYVEGTDLARLVKQHGPLAVGRACDSVRQAALGLQHAFERGLVHRDIKPANLLRTAKGDVVKVLDMGLARLDRPDHDSGASTTLTQEGAVMGTPDYIAPEQARDSHTVDIRADLYSLGCTLYFLLTGRVPFPGGSLTEKLLKHTLDEPRPVEELRPEMPAAVAAVVRKLMAKRPEDRYQTPAEAAAALVAVRVAPADGHTQAEGGAANQQAPRDGDTLESATAEVVRGAAERRRRRAAAGWRRLALYGVGGLLSLGLGVWLLALFLRFAMPPAPVAPPPASPPPVAPSSPAFAAWLKKVAALPAEEQVRAVADELKKRNPGFDGKVTPTVEIGVVVGLEFLTDEVTDIAPVRALAGLRTLSCSGSPGKGRLTDLAPLKDMKLTRLSCNSTSIADLSPLKGMKLTNLTFYQTKVEDLSPLRDMPLTDLWYDGAPVTDLSPLTGMKLTNLSCNATPVSDLSPLKKMPLTNLSCGWTRVSDLSPLEGMNLTLLHITATPVTDLSPLKEMKLTELGCEHGQVSDLSPLKDMKLTKLWCDFHPWRDRELLRSIPTLTQINGEPAADFWKEVEAQQAKFDAWCKQVAAMKPGDQVEAVKAELKKRNPDFDGKVAPAVESGVVVRLDFLTDEVTDVAPVRALAGLRTLYCSGSLPGKGRLADLSPLKDMKLTSLWCGGNPVSDLSPLKGMKLTQLVCSHSAVSDLSPLKGMPLTDLNLHGAAKVSDLLQLKDMKLLDLLCGGTGVSDLSPLKDMKLTWLNCQDTQVSDLSPLKDMKLTNLYCARTLVSDLSPLKDMKLTDLDCCNTPVSDLSPLKDMRLSILACDNTRVADLSPLKDMQLRVLLCGGTKVSDLSLLKEMPLKELQCGNTTVSDLSPLKDMPLTGLYCENTPVFDLSPLKNMMLTYLKCSGSKVSDLSPLKDMKLTGLECAGAPVSDLSPLRNMKLTTLWCGSTKISDLSPLKDMPLQSLKCDFNPARDTKLLHSIPTLETINGKPAAEFWKEFEAPAPPKP